MDQTAVKEDLDRFTAIFNRQKTASLRLRIEPVRDRQNRLHKLRSWLLANRKKLQEAVYNDFRKPAQEVETAELFTVLAEISHSLKNLNDWSRPKKVDAPMTYFGTRSEIRFEPKGVCLIISPWNYPFNLCISPLVSCLSAGCTAILKPSEMTPNTSSFIREMVEQNFDEDIVHVVEGDADSSNRLLQLPFDHIFFTGSPAVGKIVMRAAADHLASVTLELGGKSPAVIDATADLSDAAKRIAFGKFFNNGQTCIAPDYILIEKKIKDQFLVLLKENVNALFGNGKPVEQDSPDYARIVSKKHFKRLHNLVQDAIQKGAKPVLSGTPNEDKRFFPPTILTDVSADAMLMEEEIFGPVLPVIEMTSKEESIRMINENPKPLALYIFSHDSKFRERLLRGTSSGAICINDCVIQFAHPNLPFGGVNNSGMGKAHGYYGFLAFSNEKPVIRQKKGLANAYLFYPPYTDLKRRLLDWVIRWVL